MDQNLSKIGPHQVAGNKTAEHVSQCDRSGAPIQSVEATIRQSRYFNNNKPMQEISRDGEGNLQINFLKFIF